MADTFQLEVVTPEKIERIRTAHEELVNDPESWEHKDIVTRDARLAAYIERCTARPAFKRALAAQLADFREAA